MTVPKRTTPLAIFTAYRQDNTAIANGLNQEALRRQLDELNIKYAECVGVYQGGTREDSLCIHGRDLSGEVVRILREDYGQEALLTINSFRDAYLMSAGPYRKTLSPHTHIGLWTETAVQPIDADYTEYRTKLGVRYYTVIPTKEG